MQPDIVESIGWKPRNVQLLEGATCPIYLRAGHWIEPFLVGSGVLIALGERRFLVTASHVVDKIQAESAPHIGLLRDLVDLEVEFLATRMPTTGDRDDDRYDVAVAEVDLARLGWPPTMAVPPRMFDTTERDYQDELFLVSGYPHSKQASRIASNSMEAFLYQTLLTPKPPSVDEETGFVTHLDLEFDKRRLFTAGQQRAAPKLSGMSGCGAWLLDESQREVRLAGIFIEHRHPRRRLRATRIWFALSAIWMAFPELRHWLPEVDGERERSG